MVATKKIAKKRVSGARAKEIEEAKESTSDLCPFMAWLDPYMKARKAKTDVISAESAQELPEDGVIQEVDDNESSISEISDSSSNVLQEMQSHTTGRPKYVKMTRR